MQFRRAVQQSGAVVASEMVSENESRTAVRTTRNWIAEVHGLRRNQRRSKSSLREIGAAFSLIFISLCGFHTAQGQQLRDAFRSVQQAVVVVRTEQKGLAPYPQEGLVSLNGLGSGVLISNDGKLLTAAHLVQSADKTLVEFSGGELIPASVLGTAISADVALLQLDRNPGYAPAKLGDSNQVDVGDEIFVVGAPYGISRTLTVGHVSGRRGLTKENETSTPVEFLQTDAAVNNGNSGSPVFNLSGEVMGIVSNIVSKSGGSEGLAFAATSNTARRLLLEQKPFWTGIEGIVIDGNLAKALNLTQSTGLLVQRVAEGSIAWRWGIHAGTLRANVEGDEMILGGDIILRVNEVPLDNNSYDEIDSTIGRLKPGEHLVFTIFRQGQIVKLSIPTSQ